MAPNIGKFVCYYRVSTGRQGKSGLGIDAQREAVKTYLNGGDWQIVDEYTEVESGKRSDRPELDKALAAARLHRASLVVSKVDRLTRSVAFLSRLLEAGVDVRFANLPQIEGATGRFLLQQMVAVAELEVGMISARTKVARAADYCRAGHRTATGGRRNEPARHCRRIEREEDPDGARPRPMVCGSGGARAGAAVGCREGAPSGRAQLGCSCNYHRVSARSERSRRRKEIDHEMDICSDCFCCSGCSDLVDTSAAFLVYSIGRPNERQRQLRWWDVYEWSHNMESIWLEKLPKVQ